MTCLKGIGETVQSDRFLMKKYEKIRKILKTQNDQNT